MKLPNQKFAVIYADPPWSFKSWSEKGQGRAPDKHYPTMDVRRMKKMPVKELAQKDCVLLMWATMPMLPQAMQLIEAWGFKYKTVAFTWMKRNKKTPSLFIDASDIFAGTGYWTRANAELVLLATRGHPRRTHADVAQAIFAPVRQHSRKPDETYERIERLLKGPYVELFARTKREGWVSWGNQVNKFRTPTAPRGKRKASTKSPRKRKLP